MSTTRDLPHATAHRRQPSEFVKVVDVAFLCIICVAPFFLGGRYGVGRFVYVALAAVAAIAWSLHTCFNGSTRWRRSAGEWVLGLALLLVMVQVIPLPTNVLSSVSPSLAELVPLWFPADATGVTAAAAGPAAGSTSVATASTARLGTWDRISLAPTETLGGIAMLLAYGMLFLVACQRLETLSDIYRILGLVALAAVVLAVIGLVQYASGTGKYLGFYTHPFRSADGAATASFYNNNHYAHMLALGVGPLVGWLAIAISRSSGQPRSQRLWNDAPVRRTTRALDRLLNPTNVLISLGVVMFACLMSLSRGGTLVTVFAAAVATCALASRGLLSKKAVAALAVAVLLVGASMTVHGFERINARMDGLTTASIEKLDSYGYRRDIWAANWHGIQDFWRLGAGVGAHRFLLPAYLQQSYIQDWTHAESGYLQIALETGLPGLLLCAAAIGLCGYWCWSAWRGSRDVRHSVAVAAVAAGLAASVVHSIWDFVWYIPATMATTVLLAACACRLKQLVAPDAQTAPPATSPETTPATKPLPLFAWTATAVTIAASVWMLGNRAGPALASPSWDNYLRTAVKVRDSARLAARSAKAQPPTFEEQVNRTDAMIRHLQQALTRDPRNAETHNQLAAKCVARFDLAMRVSPNEMPIAQIRDAAAASQFPSRDALDAWLSRAIGPARKYLDVALAHTRRGIDLCPLQATGYLMLADLGFLGTTGSPPSAFLDQARRVGPHHGDVLIHIGAEHVASGDPVRGAAFWQEAYRAGPECRLKLVGIFAGRAPVWAFIEMFDPDRDMLRTLEWRYREAGATAELPYIWRSAVLKATAAAKQASGSDAGMHWLDAFNLHRKLEQTDEALHCGRNAVRLAAHDFRVRATVGRYLLDHGQFAEAEAHLAWCAARRPGDKKIVRELTAAKQGKLRGTTVREAATPPGPLSR